MRIGMKSSRLTEEGLVRNWEDGEKHDTGLWYLNGLKGYLLSDRDHAAFLAKLIRPVT